MAKFAHAVVVPMPTVEPVTWKIGVDVPWSPTTNAGEAPVVSSTDSSPHGVVVPWPLKPLLPMTKLVAEEEPTTNCGADPSALVGLTESKPHGDVVPTPSMLLPAPVPPARMVMALLP